MAQSRIASKTPSKFIYLHLLRRISRVSVQAPKDMLAWRLLSSHPTAECRQRMGRELMKSIPAKHSYLFAQSLLYLTPGRTAFRARAPRLAGQVLSESRLTAWQSSDGLPFAYSGKVMEPVPFSPNVLRLRDALYERTGVLYDGVLLNLYESRYVHKYIRMCLRCKYVHGADDTEAPMACASLQGVVVM